MDLLIRASSNRLLYDSPNKLFEHLDEIQEVSRYPLKIYANKKRQNRMAEIQLRYSKVKIARPKNSKSKHLPEYVELYVIEAREDESTVPNGEDPILWRLLTTHRIESVAEARQCVHWYTLRWQIEELFRLLKKKGLGIESSQLRDGRALQRLGIFSLQAAMKIMQLTLSRDGKYDVSPQLVFTEKEIVFQRVLLKTLEGCTQKQQNPYPITNLAWSAWIIARLGGWKGYAKASPRVILL